MSKKCIDSRILELEAMLALFAALIFTINDQGFEEMSQLPAVFN